jgi:hypothetical protein
MPEKADPPEAIPAIDVLTKSKRTFILNIKRALPVDGCPQKAILLEKK